LWEAEIDWMSIFKNPELHFSQIQSDHEIERSFKYVMPEELRQRFSKSATIDFDIKAEHANALRQHHRPKIVIEHAIQQHVDMCIENSTNTDEALALADLLKDEIEYRVRIYSRCLSKTTESYVRWMQDEYKRKLRSKIVVGYLSSSGGEISSE